MKIWSVLLGAALFSGCTSKDRCEGFPRSLGDPDWSVYNNSEYSGDEGLLLIARKEIENCYGDLGYAFSGSALSEFAVLDDGEGGFLITYLIRAVDDYHLVFKFDDAGNVIEAFATAP